MLKHILVPLDTSALAETALPYAKQIVTTDGKLTLLMVLDNTKQDILPPSVDFQLDPALEEALTKHKQEAQKHAQDYLDRIATDLNTTSVQVETIVQVGNPAEEIANKAQDNAVDAIVMSTHGRTGLSSWLLGSVTQKVIGITTCPVFVIPPKKD